jgi:hypothetical protein
MLAFSTGEGFHRLFRDYSPETRQAPRIHSMPVAAWITPVTSPSRPELLVSEIFRT